jgi:hypothetical protein
MDACRSPSHNPLSFNFLQFTSVDAVSGFGTLVFGTEQVLAGYGADQPPALSTAKLPRRFPGWFDVTANRPLSRARQAQFFIDYGRLMLFTGGMRDALVNWNRVHAGSRLSNHDIL